MQLSTELARLAYKNIISAVKFIFPPPLAPLLTLPAFLTNFVTAVAENLMPYWFDPTRNQPQKTTHC